MKIVIPTKNKKGLKDRVSAHFGRCQTYTFISEKGDLLKIINNDSEHMGGSGLPPEIIKKHGAQILLCRGLGPRALNLCRELGIEVYVAEIESVKKIFEDWKNKKIKKADAQNTCEQHR